MGRRVRKAAQPAHVAELLQRGTVILRSSSRDGLGEMIDALPAETRYAAGAIAFDSVSGLYHLRLDLIK